MNVKCPDCSAPMEEGFIYDLRGVWPSEFTDALRAIRDQVTEPERRDSSSAVGM